MESGISYGEFVQGKKFTGNWQPHGIGECMRFVIGQFMDGG